MRVLQSLTHRAEVLGIRDYLVMTIAIFVMAAQLPNLRHMVAPEIELLDQYVLPALAR